VSVVKTLDVFCDGKHCTRWSPGVSGQGATAFAAVDVAKKSGWTHKYGKDYCPKCSLEGL